MRVSRRSTLPETGTGIARTRRAGPDGYRSTLLPALLLAVGAAFWLHRGLFTDPLPGMVGRLLVDVAVALPLMAMAVGLVDSLTVPRDRVRGAIGDRAVRSAALAVTAVVFYVPAAAVQAFLRTATETSATRPLAEALATAVRAAPVLLLVATICVLFAEYGLHRVRDDLARPPGPGDRRVPGRLAATGLLLSAMLVVPTAGAEPVWAGPTGCDNAARRTFDVSAINLDITVNRFGDHDPYGFMYVLAERENDVRRQEAALLAASAMDRDDPAAAKVSVGLGQDPIQPLVIRARLGECVVINLTNKLTMTPRGGPLGNPALLQPGGVPSVSIDMSGVAYDAAGGDGGQAVGANPVAVMVAPGQTRQYRYFLDPSMGEGAKVFQSGGESTQLTAHGLFGALVAEPAGARWYDPVTGVDRTSDTGWNNWEAMVRPGAGPAFREFTLMYHEIGDVNFNLRRPLRENDEGIPIGQDPGVPVGDQEQYGRPLPMFDVRPPTPQVPTEGGGGTSAYRPASRAINYRSESFHRRLQLEARRGSAAQQANKSLAYSSYTYGDPATPMPRSYLGEPTKTRVVHAGFEQLHVHHVHGGGTRWLANPDGTDAGTTIRLDSQTISPRESFDLVHECGAGGCQQAAGDFLYHCHIGQHYVAGMWGLWRVFDTAQSDLAPLPGAAALPVGVTSAQLIGHRVQGREVVPRARLRDPSRQVALETLVEGYLPPPGARWGTETGTPDPDDATVWDWVRSGPTNAPVYLGEPETTETWANYRPSNPGTRPEILFNPTTGRPAYPMLRPHLGMRPPFAPGGHSGTPGLGDTAGRDSPNGICPQRAPVRPFDITAISVAVQSTARERDDHGRIFVLNEDKDAVRAGTKPVDPLVIRSNVGDCVALTFGSELDPAAQSKVNMHTHLVLFDPLGSDGVVAGFAYEQSVFAAGRDGRRLTSASGRQITVDTVGKLRPGVAIGIGVGRKNVEVRTVTAIEGDRLVLDRPLTKSHTAGEPVTVEFVQYRWYSDMDTGTVFWHDHVDAIRSWAHGLFAAHIVEPPGSTYHDPRTGKQVKSGTIVDVVNRSGSVGVGQAGAFREFTIFLHNGRRGRTELTAPPSVDGLNPFNAGQECEEGSINLRAAPLGERTPPGATPADPTTTDQRREYNGARCRNAFTRTPAPPEQADANTVRATVTTVDPYVFSSVKYGDPDTPLLRAYLGDPVVIRTVGVNDRAESLRVQGHRFRKERFDRAGQLVDTATTGISERFDFVMDGGAGGPARSPGDYLYYSTRTFALDSGAWGLFRVHDRRQADLRPLPGHRPPAPGAGFPRQRPATGDTQAAPGPDPASARRADGTPDPTVVTATSPTCPGPARQLRYDVSVINQELPTAPNADPHGVIYVLTADVAAVRAGHKSVEPLVLRANAGDCVVLTLRNQTTPGSRYGGHRAGLDLAKLLRNQQLAAGAAIGLNPDPTVAPGQTATYTFHADRELGASLFQNLASVASLRHGGYGMLIVEPAGSTWSDSTTGKPLGPDATSTGAVIRPPGAPAFREFALLMQTTDQHFARGVLPYGEFVAGSGVNSPTAANRQIPPVPGAPPGTEGNAGSADKAYSHVNYRSEPLTERLGLTAHPDDYTRASVTGSFGTAFSSADHGEPRTPVLRAITGDPVVLRVGVGASDQLHPFTVSGHAFRPEPRIHGSPQVSTRTLGAGETVDARLGGAGGGAGNSGDYLYADARAPFAAAGMWGILRVLPSGRPGGAAPL
ncbi:hypothetical protein ACIBO1_29825 [Micromonospora sp. NPDC049903]|uniref:hypothetical protein n=1 Tax=Micromonospora sp. NPDC049903 TaxID=3364276 RepID=UPI003799CCE5